MPVHLSTSMLACFLLFGCASSGDGPGSAGRPLSEGEVQAFGALRAMFHEGETGAAITLDALLPDPDLYGVGALEDLGGEVTIVGGKAYLSYPDSPRPRTEAASKSDAGACLLVVGRVSRWQTRTVERPIGFDGLDTEIGRLAAEAGLDLDQRIPFLLEGEFENLDFHVIDGSRLEEGGTSHEDHLAAAVKVERDRAKATLIGFYSRSDQGVFTHRDSFTHIHCVIPEPLMSGHVDRVWIPAGTVVKFPSLSMQR